MGAAQAWAEALACACLQQHQGTLSECVPRLVAVGGVKEPQTEGAPPSDSSTVTHAILFVAMTMCPGTALDAAGPGLFSAQSRQLEQLLAGRLGRLAAQLHSAPLPNGQLFAPGPAQQQGCHFTLWQRRAGLDLSFPTNASLGSAQALLAHLGLQQQVNSANGTACVRLSSSQMSERLASGNGAAGQASGRPVLGGAAAELWRPFAEFLRERRARAPAELAWEHSLPQRLQDQVEAYLMPDPATYLPSSRPSPAGNAAQPPSATDSGCYSAGEQPAPAGADDGEQMAGGTPDDENRRVFLPSWLHGDLIAKNILVSEELLAAASSSNAGAPGLPADEAWLAGNAVQLIDFGDAGHGDPLYDIVLLLVDTLR